MTATVKAGSRVTVNGVECELISVSKANVLCATAADTAHARAMGINPLTEQQLVPFTSYTSKYFLAMWERGRVTL